MEQLVRRAIMDLQAEGVLSAASVLAQVQVTRTKNKQHGDFASNVALLAAKAAGRPPRELAEAIAQHLPANDALDRIEIAGPGFINFYLKPIANQAIIADILAAGANYGRNQIGVGRKVLVEFVSANPTGPLHVGHGRQAALGDAIATLLEAIGWSVTREFYYNDAGSQIENLGLSVQARLAQLAGQERPIPPGGYHGEYICELAQRYT
ncbi:MAG: arginine--tRNA ligase, partial [Pseudomonadota bacterium]|nr:arginine--tRNA ligase [Pseudomonadota bacterium]